MNKDMNYFWSLLYIMAMSIGLSLSSCGGDDDSTHEQETGPELSLDKSSINLDANGDGEKTIVVSTKNTDFSISVTEGSAWLNADKSGQIVTITAGHNISTNSRVGRLKIIASAKPSISLDVIVNQSGSALQLSVGNNNIIFGSGEENNFMAETRTLQIKSNTSWIISKIPDWMSISTTSGNGDQTISLATKSFNNSSKARTATLIISTEDNNTSANVDISQEAGLATDCIVTPTNIISLYNGIAFDFDYQKNATRFFSGYMKASEVGLISETEIIRILEEHFERRPVSKDYFIDYDNLEENTSYYFYTVGYDSNGKRGELNKTEVSTKKLLNNWELNEPMAWIGIISQDTQKWWWTVTKGSRCRTFYEAATEDESLAFASDVCQAWLIDYLRRTGSIYEYENAETLYVTKEGNLLAVFTWGKDSNGTWASRINWAVAYNNTSSSKIMSKINSKKAEKNSTIHKIPAKDSFRVKIIAR